MQIFDIKPEFIKNSKKCSACKNEIKPFDSEHNTENKVYYGHSNYRSFNGDCCSFICEECAGTRQGYIADCECGDYL